MRDAAFAERIEYHLAKRDADVAAISDRNAGVGSARETCKALVVMDRAALVDLGEKAAAAAARLFAARAHAEAAIGERKQGVVTLFGDRKSIRLNSSH